MARKRIYTTTAKRWDRNPMAELAKLRAKELQIPVREAWNLIKLETELAKI